MVKQINRLTALMVRNERRPGRYCDGDGLWLCIAAGGSRSWVFRYHVGGQRREMGLGPVRDRTLSEARAAVRELRQLIRDGEDPLRTRQKERAAARVAAQKAMTFADCAAAYIRAHRPSWRSEKHVRQWESTLAAYALPVIGPLPVSDVETAHLVRILEPIWSTRNETAIRLRGRIEVILDWATVSGFRAGANPARWRGHLDHLLARHSRTRRIQHYPALPWKEAPAFMRVLSGCAGMAARALEFAIHTAARSSEVRGARWEEVDLEAQLWTIPPARMKAGVAHRVPLTEPVVTLLTAGRAMSLSPLVFPGRNGRPMSDMTLSAVLRRMGRSDITVHGFRSTFRDWCSEGSRAHATREMCEMALAHAVENRVEAAYRRGDILEKRRELMREWSGFLQSCSA